jgi:hypothetical protein
MGHQVDAFIGNEDAYKLLKPIPCFDNLYHINDTLFCNVYHQYDKIYLITNWHNPAYYSIIPNVIPYNNWQIWYNTAQRLNAQGLTYNEDYCRINLNWYNDFLYDFKCNSNSVLLETISSRPNRTYAKMKELVHYLSLAGFDVRILNLENDIRTNLHLIDQVPYVLTTDTGLLWMTKAIGKSPHVYLSRGKDGNKFRFDKWENRLGVKNIVSWYDTLNEIPSEEIVQEFKSIVTNNL